MSDTIPTPQLGDPLPACQPSEETLTLLSLRRSTSAKMMTGPGPGEAQLARLIAIAARVPDHRRVVPYRFLTFAGEARSRAGAILGKVFEAANPDAPADQIALERERFERAPVVVAVISRVDKTHKTPEWEQVLTAGAACQNMLVAASAMGFAAQWLTEWYAYDQQVLRALGLADDERVAGFIYLGTASEPPLERPRVDPASISSAF